MLSKSKISRILRHLTGLLHDLDSVYVAVVPIFALWLAHAQLGHPLPVSIDGPNHQIEVMA